MLIVDSQVHIWTSGMPTNRAHRQISSFTKDDLLKEMDEAGVNAAVIHPPGWDPNANEVAVDAARQHPDRLSILGNFPLDRPESRALVDGWKQRPGMLGLRFTFQQPHQQAWLRDGSLDWLWSAAERARVPIGLAAASFLPQPNSPTGVVFVDGPVFHNHDQIALGVGQKVQVGQRITVDGATPKRFAAARQLIPSSTAADARDLKSIDSGLPIHTGLFSSQ